MSKTLTNCGACHFHPQRSFLKKKVVSLRQLHLSDLRFSKCPKSNSKVLSGAFPFEKKNKLGISSLLKTA